MNPQIQYRARIIISLPSQPHFSNPQKLNKKTLVKYSDEEEREYASQ